MIASTQYLRVRIANAENKRSAFKLRTLASAEGLPQPLPCPLALPYLTSNQSRFTLPAACQHNLFLQFRNHD